MARHFRGYPSRPIIVGKSALVGNAYYFTVAESVTAAETLTNSAVFASTLAESASAADTNSAAAIFANSISESGSASDTVTSALLVTGSVSESVTAADSTSAAVTFASSDSESGSASDTSSALAIFASTQSESGSAADSNSASVIFGPTLSESGSSSDTIAAAAVFGSTVSESGAAADSDSGSADFANTLSESATAADSTDGTVVSGSGGNVYNETIAEGPGGFQYGAFQSPGFQTGIGARDTVSAEVVPGVRGGGPAFPYPRGKELRRGLGRGRSLRDICDEIEREIAEPVITLAPALDRFASEYFDRQIDELERAIAEFAEERRELDSYRDDVIAAHANALLRRLRDEEEMCALLLLTHH